ncbi:MAG TPA: 3-dehydroquinate synthase II, partial [Candidatus Thermoplasmatota archaeon]|nr:3-dehydroquinate synthase II [Candidatus Thermoplasmatota archaeon]
MGAFAWIHVPPTAGGKDIVTAALEAGFDTLLFDPGEAARHQGLGKFRALTLEAEALVDEQGQPLGPRVTLRSAADQDRAMALAGKAGILVITGADWKI